MHANLDPIMYCRLDTATSDAKPQLFRQVKLWNGYTPSQGLKPSAISAASEDRTKMQP